VAGAAHWADGHWTLEPSRALETGSRFDQEFARASRSTCWVSVLDRPQTRHTRHPCPIKIDLR
jgi:hypothetical protein